MGTSTPGANGGKRPLKSKYWILSSPNKAYLDAAAELFGGVVEPWEHEKKKEWRLITQTTQLPVYVLPFAPQQALELYANTSVRCKCRNSVAHRSMLAPTSASVLMNSACKSR